MIGIRVMKVNCWVGNPTQQSTTTNQPIVCMNHRVPIMKPIKIRTKSKMRCSENFVNAAFG